MKGHVLQIKQKMISRTILIYTITFFLIVAVGYLPLWKNGLSIIWNVDGIGQYLPSFLYIGQYLRGFLTGLLHGEILLPLWDLSIGMGEDIVGALNYYGFGDPLNLIAIFATSSNGAYLYTGCFFLRLWLSGYAFQTYCREINMKSGAAAVASLCYAFCGFAIYGGGRYIEWLSVLIYFPLLLVGVERSLKAKRRTSWILVLSVAYGACCGFYFLYMSSLCLVVYCCVRLIFLEGITSVKNNLKKCFSLLWDYVLGLFLAAPIFLSAVSAYFNSERSMETESIKNIILNAKNYFPHLNMSLISVVFNFLHSREQNLSGILLVQILSLVLLFFIRSRKALQLKVAVLMAVAALHLPITGWVFNGFGESNDRWYFWIHFLLALVLAYVLTVFSSITISNTKNDIKLVGRKLTVVTVFVFVTANIIVNIWLLYSFSANWKSEMIAYETVEEYIDSPLNNSTIVSNDESLFRISNDSLTNINGRPENVAMINDYYGTTWWFSIINADTQSFADMVAGEKLNWRSYGLYNNLIYEAFAGVKYYFSSGEVSVDEEYLLADAVEFNGSTWNVYENPYYFGMAYVRDSQGADTILSESESYEDYYEKLYDLYINEHETVDVTYSESKSTFTCTVNVDDNDEVIFLIPYNKNWKAYVDGEKAEIEKTDIMYISVSLEEGEHIIVLKYESIEMKVGLFLLLLSIIRCIIRKSINRKRDFSLRVYLL